MGSGELAAPSRGDSVLRRGRALVGQHLHGVISVASVLTVFIAWYLTSTLGLINPNLLPSPGSVFKAFVITQGIGFRGYSLTSHIEISMIRVAEGFAFSVVIGVPVGLAMGRSRTLQAVLDPFVQFFRPLPPLGYYTLLILWFGIGETAKVLLLVLSATPIIVVSCAAAVQSVREGHIRAAQMLGLNQRQIFTRVVFFVSLPHILTSLRLALGAIFGSLVAAEIIAATRGLGFVIFAASDFLQTSVVFMAIMIIGTIAFILDRLAVLAQRVLVPWQGRA